MVSSLTQPPATGEAEELPYIQLSSWGLIQFEPDSLTFEPDFSATPSFVTNRGVTSHLQHPSPAGRRSRAEAAKQPLILTSLPHQEEPLQVPHVLLL